MEADAWAKTPEIARNALTLAYLKATERRFTPVPVQITGFADMED